MEIKKISQSKKLVLRTETIKSLSNRAEGNKGKAQNKDSITSLLGCDTDILGCLLTTII